VLKQESPKPSKNEQRRATDFNGGFKYAIIGDFLKH
jgi:hypothetical protein